MYKFFLVFLLFPICIYAQNTDLEIKIDSITSIDSSPNQRIFTVNYHIKNKTNSAVSFILNPNSLNANATNSLSYIPSYKLYQEQTYINAENIFGKRKSQEIIEKALREIQAKKSNSQEYFIESQKKTKEKNSKSIITNVIKLNPKEIRNYTIHLDWDKNRYIKYFDNEYYLDEKATHYIDININFFKEELYNRLLPEDLKTITEDKTIIKGWIQSNKMEINFKE